MDKRDRQCLEPERSHAKHLDEVPRGAIDGDVLGSYPPSQKILKYVLLSKIKQLLYAKSKRMTV